ncbi:MAG TPA: glycoside hydrolase family 15 protein [Patescibacteria group bacterium]|jgi:GH15 family glucan-1,4-alpha-glucosidase
MAKAKKVQTSAGLDYGIIGNCETAALVSKEASIDWFCFPRFDSPSAFGRLLDSKQGGFFSLKPVGAKFWSKQSYLEDTNILVTTFVSDEAEVEVTDFMPIFSEPYRTRPLQRLCRRVKVVRGTADVEMIMEPAFDYARTAPKFEFRSGVWLARGEGQTFILSSNAVLVDAYDKKADRLERTFALKEGEVIDFVLGYRKNLFDVGQFDGNVDNTDVLEKTTHFWRQWLWKLEYNGPYLEHVKRSALALKLLTYAPTGAVVAAATTSVPEEIGTNRTWDYRYCWLRDASFTVDALFRVGLFAEALAFMHFLREAISQGGPEIQIMYRVDGAEEMTELKLDHLAGYKNSVPVRIGNRAANQLQLDAFGEVIDIAAVVFEEKHYLSPDMWSTLSELVEVICKFWREPDNGIWELHDEKFKLNYTASKVQAWVAVDRGVRLAKRMKDDEKAKRWSKVCAEIKDDVMTHGWNKEKQAFTIAYEREEMDAAVLHMPLFGFLDAKDPKMKKTVKRIIKELSSGDFIRRYNMTDDQGETQAAMIICNLWLAQVLAKQGEVDEAKRRYEQILEHANHLNLFSENIDPESGELTGNFPQAYTHIAIIQTALALEEAAPRKKSKTTVGTAEGRTRRKPPV